MAKTTTSPFLQQSKHAEGSITTATGAGTKVTIFTAGTNDSVLKSLNLASTDTAAINVQIFVNVSGTDRLLGTVPIPANSGNNGSVPSVDVLRSSMLPSLSYDAYGNKVLNLKAGTTVKISAITAPAAGKQIDIVGEAGDF